MYNYFTVLADLKRLQESFINGWIGPVYFIVLAVFAITFLKNREFRKLAAYGGIATIVALLIFAAERFVGQEGKLTKAAETVIEEVNTIGLINYVKLMLPF